MIRIVRTSTLTALREDVMDAREDAARWKARYDRLAAATDELTRTTQALMALLNANTASPIAVNPGTLLS